VRVLFLFNLIPNQMVVLKTPSQVNSFVKRMTEEHAEYHDEGCACCGYSVHVMETPTRVILQHETMNMGDFQMSVEVLAVKKGRAR
jgi:hypothetical protein